MTRHERDDAQIWVTLLVVSLAIVLCLAGVAYIVERVAPNLKPGVGASTASAHPSCGNCGVIAHVRELRTAVSPQEGTPQAGGRAGIVLIILGAIGGNFHIDPGKIYQVEVRMQDGSVRTFQSAAVPVRKPGERVKVVRGRIEQIS